MPTNKCKKCAGKGYHYAKLRDLGGKTNDSCGVDHIVPCDQTGCISGIFDRDVYYKSWDIQNT